MRNATDGHVPLPIRDRFLKRFSDDYPSRYVTVLKQENIRILQEVTFYLASEIKEQVQATAVGPVGSASRAPQDTEPRRSHIASECTDSPSGVRQEDTPSRLISIVVRHSERRSHARDHRDSN